MAIATGSVEFPAEDGSFLLLEYADMTKFRISTGEDPIINSQRQQIYHQPPHASFNNQSPARRPIAVVKVIRADIGPNGKPTNFIMHNLSAHVNIYSENQANVSYLLEKVHAEMGDNQLLLVGPNGLVYHDQEGTRGTYNTTFYIYIDQTMT